MLPLVLAPGMLQLVFAGTAAGYHILFGRVFLCEVYSPYLCVDARNHLSYTEWFFEVVVCTGD